ncbi:methyl-accepting chemotaxis protein [Actinoplanes sp. ATCC 53533]|uniref:methyl-accepting chemotaxis protein n=1 Tax=Actinoplanes sp. ATCC 53533 TaxID=1288362 RepID=UPI00131574DD|nr:methyl-accepting chemotaxis protein [Actinoplanes sp. ATCC 53533]
MVGMLDTLRRIRISTRMAAAMTVLLALLGGIVFIGLSAISDQRTATQVVSDYQRTTRLAMQVKFRSADFNGWQTAYAFDVARGIPDAATDASASRASFLASAQAFRAETAALGRGRLTDAQQLKLKDATTQFDRFMTLDQQIADDYRRREPARITAAHEIVAGEEIAIFNQIAAGIDEIVTSVDASAVDAVAQASEGSRHSTIVIISAGVAAVLLGALLALLLIQSIIRPLFALNQRLAEIADGDGDLTQRITDHGRDEVATACSGFNRFADRMQKLVADVGASARQVASGADQLTTVSTQLATGAEETSTQAGVVSASAEEVSAIVATMAASAEEMSASISEIARSTSQATHIAERGVHASEEANATISRLGSSSDEVQSVVKLINAIAQQTNLLALNATIEAARAGDAGKGFAVVAGEVKDLAQQTATATESIAQQIQAIRASSDEAAQAISKIGTVVTEINNTQLAIASAIEEQTATTSEMSRNVGETAVGAAEIASNISGVAQTANQTSAAANSTSMTAADLNRASNDLRELVASFRY